MATRAVGPTDALWQFGCIAPIFEEFSRQTGALLSIPRRQCSMEGSIPVGSIAFEVTRVSHLFCIPYSVFPALPDLRKA